MYDGTRSESVHIYFTGFSLCKIVGLHLCIMYLDEELFVKEQTSKGQYGRSGPNETGLGHIIGVVKVVLLISPVTVFERA